MRAVSGLSPVGMYARRAPPTAQAGPRRYEARLFSKSEDILMPSRKKYGIMGQIIRARLPEASWIHSNARNQPYFALKLFLIELFSKSSRGVWQHPVPGIGAPGTPGIRGKFLLGRSCSNRRIGSPIWEKRTTIVPTPGVTGRGAEKTSKKINKACGEEGRVRQKNTRLSEGSRNRGTS